MKDLPSPLDRNEADEGSKEEGGADNFPSPPFEVFQYPFFLLVFEYLLLIVSNAELEDDKMGAEFGDGSKEVTEVEGELELEY